MPTTLPSRSRSIVAAAKNKTPSLYEIAHRQKLFLYVALISLLTYVPLISSFMAFGWMGLFTICELKLWCVYKLGRTLQMFLPTLWLCLIGVFILGGSLLTLLVLSLRATKALKSAAIHVDMDRDNASQLSSISLVPVAIRFRPCVPK